VGEEEGEKERNLKRGKLKDKEETERDRETILFERSFQNIEKLRAGLFLSFVKNLSRLEIETGRDYLRGGPQKIVIEKDGHV